MAIGAAAVSLGHLQVIVSANARQFERVLKRAEQKITATSKKMSSIGLKMSMALTAPLAAVATKSVYSFAKFDDAMTKSTAIMGNLSDDMKKKMEDTARTMSTQTITSAQDLAKSYYYLASAGMTAEQSIGALSTVEKFAVAGTFDMAKATELLSDSQKALGLDSKNTAENMKGLLRVSDVLVRANTLANASVLILALNEPLTGIVAPVRPVRLIPKSPTGRVARSKSSKPCPCVTSE